MPERSSRQEHGPLSAGLAGEFRAGLAGQGFSEDGTRRHLRLMEDLGEWLAARGLGPAGMTGEVIDEFARERRREGRELWTPEGLAPLLGFLRDRAGAPAPETCPAPEPASAEERLLAGFERYLVSERALTPGSARVYATAARAFAAYACLPGGGVRPLAASQVTKFIMAESTRRSVQGARMTVTAVRVLLRWLHQCGTLPSDLSGAVPGVAPWSGRRAISPPSAGQVSAVLAACGQAPRTGARDYAIVLMLARYGLRKSEVAALRLEDIDWRSGKITVRGKRSHTDTLPLASDLGEALAAYLAGRRPGSSCRALFLTAKAPARPLAAATIGDVVANACQRAGVPPFGPHRLRHFTGAAVGWASHPPRGGTRPEYWSRRLEAVRLFARHMHALDPAHEVPPQDILPFRGYRRTGGHRYTAEETAALIAAAGRLRPRLRALTWQTFLALLSVTGLRTREACCLDDDDIDLDGSWLRVRESKFNITRTLPLEATAAAALDAYMRERDTLITRSCPALFVTGTGKRLDHRACDTFAVLRRKAGLQAPSGERPARLIDFRHSFAVTTLIGCIRDGGDVARCLPLLSAWLGHGDPASSYWYIEADPELLGLAAGRLNLNPEGTHERPVTAYPGLFHPPSRARARRRA